jgi:hypothetical protein
LKPLTSLISGAVEPTFYSQASKLFSFYYKNMRVEIQKKAMTVYMSKDEAEARGVLDWLKGIIETGKKTA